MDSIEAGRKRAEHLHRAAVELGLDPISPYAFACSEASRRLLSVEKVPKGDVRLHGGKAVYDPDALLIVHEETTDEFTNAFLVAHEIGHVEFGGEAELSSVQDIEPLQSAEAVPLGVDRVADYSHRQRREAQMNVFAREFLLPRFYVRKLHLEDRLTAQDISLKLKAPHAVVSQQLLDALLLPPIEPSAEDNPRRWPLKPDQAEAAGHDGTPYLLEAGPGTGKTQTLVGRVEHLLRQRVDPARILILTFSNKAAGELAERVAETHPAAVASIWIGTFHAFGLDIVRRFHDQLGLPPDPRLIDRTDAIEFLEEEYPRLELTYFKNLWDPSQPLRDILAAISRANDEVVDAKGYRALAEAMLASASTEEERLAASRSLEVAQVFATYERLKLAKGCIDFGDLVAMPVRLCETFPEIRAHLAELYEHILVDEFQDVNRSSVRLLKALCGDGRNLWVVGDVKQSIYRFRGASAFNVSRFGHEDFPGGKRGRLARNYRSVEEIIDAFLTFGAKMPSVKGLDISLVSERGRSEHTPEYRSTGSAEDEVAIVAEAIEEMRSAGYRYRDQAVLSSGNERLSRFAKDLERIGIPVLYLGSLFERDEIKDLLSLLSVLIDRRAMGLLRVAVPDAQAVPLADVANVLMYLKEHDIEPMGWVLVLGEIQLTDSGRQGLEKIAQLLTGCAANANPWDVLTKVLFDRTRIAAEIAEAEDFRAKSRGVAIWQFMNFVRSQPRASGLPIYRLLERIRRLVLLADERDLRQLPVAAQGIDAVRLMTMHGSKGLEFPVVHIPGLNAGSLPRSPNSSIATGIAPPDGLIEGAAGKGIDAVKAAIAEEQECLFLVALSRARDRLFLYSPTRTANGRARARSPFLDRLASQIVCREVAPEAPLPASEDDAPVPVVFEGDFAFSDHQLGLYQRCPRRFLYTHVLEVGGRQRESAFMKLHGVVKEVVDEMTGLDSTGIPSIEALKTSLETAWAKSGPADHGYSEDYKRIAWQLLRFYLDSISGMSHLPIPELRLPIEGGKIVIRPDQHMKDGGGNVVMRRVDTGHKKSKEEESLATAAFHLAASSHAPGCRVELVHLSDAEITPVAMTARVLSNRRESITQMSRDVRSGMFPAKELITCPRCPSFFICGRLPAGKLVKEFHA